MLSDIEIINKSKMKNIEKLATDKGILKSELFCYGNIMAKVSLDIFKRLKDKKDGNLILVTAITPTPAGEGKSTTTIGLVDSLNKIGLNTIGTIREPSLGPVFGVKGGAAGGGYAQVNPMAEFNLHFTGDMHAITTCNNLISAAIDNHIYQGNELDIDPENIVWKRCMDLNDRALRKVQVGLKGKKETPRYDYFNITVASEIMAILCLANSFNDLREMLDKTLVAYTKTGKEIFIKDLGITGSLMVLLKDAIKPNLIQTLENNLMIAHGGPFANIAHGCNSILATKLALKISDYVVTEAGFGSDLGAEKFLDIKCHKANLNPNLVVLVSTIRALKYHGGCSLDNLNTPSVEYLKQGICNLEKHYQNIQKFNLPCVVALNKFPTDSTDEIEYMLSWAKEHSIKIALSEVYEKGSLGGIELAKLVQENVSLNKYQRLYDVSERITTKIEKLAHFYGAKDVYYTDKVKEILPSLEKYQDYYICMAKTPNSLSDNPKLLGVPKDFTLTISDIRVSTGSKFIICLTGNIMTMPGLSKSPQALKIDIDENYNITGLM